MREFYILAEKCRELRVNVQVDHEVPLQHPLVCGLDCEFNYRLITVEQNRAKHNRFEV